MIALVKIDVAAALLEKSAAKIFELVDGGNTREPGLEWVFNLAKDLHGQRRDLRFWQPELLARAQKGTGKYTDYKIEQVIDWILPATRKKFFAGEVDKLFQIRNRTRLDFGAAMPGEIRDGRNVYSREVLAEFLECRWQGTLKDKIRVHSSSLRHLSRCATPPVLSKARRNGAAIKRGLRPFPQTLKKLNRLGAPVSAKTPN